ncbi:hypothetical protein N8344_00505 [bacterium]|nr:hypothetical protein [bacterium]
MSKIGNYVIEVEEFALDFMDEYGEFNVPYSDVEDKVREVYGSMGVQVLANLMNLDNEFLIDEL